MEMNACDCDVPKPILEFQNSEYVFEGEIISKVYAQDSLSYTITFDISKHYKNGEKPKELKFTLRSEGKYLGVYTSCDWSVNKNQKWLVYAYRGKNQLGFSNICSNSKPIHHRSIPKREQEILNHANDFDINKYTFTFLDGEFSYVQPLKNIDSLLRKIKIKDYGEEYRENRVDVVVDIDKNGNLMSANLFSQEHVKSENEVIIDTIFNLNKPLNIEYREAQTDFEKDILKVVRLLKKWEVTYLKNTETPVRMRKFMQFHKETGNIKVYY
ncbi:MAG: hypothetical protein ACTH3E_06270 [Psychroflexus halocasei]